MFTIGNMRQANMLVPHERAHTICSCCEQTCAVLLVVLFIWRRFARHSFHRRQIHRNSVTSGRVALHNAIGGMVLRSLEAQEVGLGTGQPQSVDVNCIFSLNQEPVY